MWVSIADASFMCRLPRSTLYTWIRSGRLVKNSAGLVCLLDVQDLSAARILDPADRLRPRRTSVSSSEV